MRILTGLFSIVMMFFAGQVYAQRPSGVPYDNEPVGFFDSITNIIFYIVIPLAIIVLYVIWRRKTKNDEEK